MPDCRANREIPVLVGTNVLDVLYETCAAFEETSVSNNQVHCADTPLIKKLYSRHKFRKASGKLET